MLNVDWRQIITNFAFKSDTRKIGNVCKLCNNKRAWDLKKSKLENFEWKDLPNKLKCTMCNETKNIEYFNKRKDTISGVRLECRTCVKKYQREYRYNRRQNDDSFKLTLNLRTRTKEAFKSQKVRKE